MVFAGLHWPVAAQDSYRVSTLDAERVFHGTTFIADLKRENVRFGSFADEKNLSRKSAIGGKADINSRVSVEKLEYFGKKLKIVCKSCVSEEWKLQRIENAMKF
jgi:hypothetical protein